MTLPQLQRELVPKTWRNSLALSSSGKPDGFPSIAFGEQENVRNPAYPFYLCTDC
jgi:hypothetical protein